MSSSLIKVFVLSILALALSGCGGSSESSDSQYDGLVSIQGSIEVKADTSIDRDVEGSCSTLTPQNNSIDQAQQISNPNNVGGYLNGLHQDLGICQEYEQDLDDYYRVSLVEGQSISLSVFAADDNNVAFDVSLELRTVSSPDLIASEITISEPGAKSLSVNETDEYYVRVSALEDSYAVLYTLSLSQSLSADQLRRLNLASSTDFVPGEVLLIQKEEAKKASSSKRSALNSLASDAFIAKHDLKFSKRAGEKAKLYHFDILGSNIAFRSSNSSSGRQGSLLEKKIETLKVIDALQQEDGVLVAEPNYYRQAAFVPNDNFYTQQWNLSMLNLEEAWDVATGEGVVVAVIDSGVNPDHPDLAGQITNSSYDFISDSDYSGDGDGFDSDPRDLSTTQHGAHVTGIVAAKTGNGEGIAGVAYDSEIMALRVLGVENEEGISQGTDADLANAILYAGGLDNDSGQVPTQAADIINLSLGGGGYSDTLKRAIEAVIAEGTIVIAAAGNESSSQSLYPAAFDGVIAVSSITPDLELSGFSNFGAYIDVAAPGGDTQGSQSSIGILSTVSGSSYAEYLGTSMAAPHISGVAALMMSVNPDLDASSFTYALENGLLTDVIGDENHFGYGLINAHKAVAWASGNVDIPDELYYFPKTFSFFNELVNAKLYLSNTGSGNLRVTHVGPSDLDESWLDVSRATVDNEGLGTYDIEINSAQIPVNTFKKGSLLVRYQINEGDSQEVEIGVLASNTISGE